LSTPHARSLCLSLAVVALFAIAGGGSRADSQESVDDAVNRRIRDEGLNRSQVDRLFNHLVDRVGPRLAGSPEYNRSAEWARQELAGWGLADARLEPFEFGRGWVLDKFTLEMVEPRYMPLVGYPEAWSPSTPGEVLAPVRVLAGQSADDVEATQAVLRGAAVMTSGTVTNFIRSDRAQPTSQPEAAVAAGRETGRGGRGQGQGRGRGRGAATGPSEAQRINTAIRAGGAVVQLKPSRGEHGTLFVQAGRDNPDDLLPKVVLIGEHYNLLMRLAAEGVPVTIRVNVQARFLDDDLNSYNVLAELPGVDPVLGREVVMLGAHLDSWHTAVGATDNADGAAVALEALRILKAIGVQPRRTIRVALWGAEEEGLIGSREWVARHLEGDANANARRDLAVYFNIDPGKGPIYGWYLEDNAEARPIFDAWLAPFADLGARRNVPQGIGSTDHVSFNRAGVPGFNPVQDYVGYDVREHHTNVDTPERLSVDDLKQNAVILASFLYHAARRTPQIPSAVRR
jgi:hypothetical protein